MSATAQEIKVTISCTYVLIYNLIFTSILYQQITFIIQMTLKLVDHQTLMIYWCLIQCHQLASQHHCHKFCLKDGLSIILCLSRSGGYNRWQGFYRLTTSMSTDWIGCNFDKYHVSVEANTGRIWESTYFSISRKFVVAGYIYKKSENEHVQYASIFIGFQYFVPERRAFRFIGGSNNIYDRDRDDEGQKQKESHFYT